MDDKSSGLLKHSSKNHRRRGTDLRGPWLCLITRADTTRIIRATAVTTINQVGAEVSGLRCLTADHRPDALNANRAVGHHIEAKFAIIISGLPRAQKCSAKTCSFLFRRRIIAVEWTSLRAISEWPITARHSNRYVGDAYALLFISYITKGQGAKTSKKEQKAEACRSPLLTERCQLNPRGEAPLKPMPCLPAVGSTFVNLQCPSGRILCWHRRALRVQSAGLPWSKSCLTLRNGKG